MSDDDHISSESNEARRDAEQPEMKLPLTSGTSLLVCPCCQQHFEDDDILESHLRKDHLIADANISLFTKMASKTIATPKEEPRQRSPKENRLALMTANPAEGEADVLLLQELSEDQLYRCQTCSMTFLLVDELFEHQSKTNHLDMQQTPRGPGYLCWRKGCNQYFKSLDNLHIHFNEIHTKSVQRIGPSNFPHVCNYCCLAFKDKEHLQCHHHFHSQKEGSNFCILCSREFEQLPELKQHYEVFHLQGQRSVPVPGLFASEESERASSTPSNSKPDSPIDFDEAHFKCDCCKLGFSAQIQLAAHMRSNAHKRAVTDSQNQSMRCFACGVNCAGQEQLQEHLRSPGHQLRIQLSFATGGNPFFLPMMKMGSSDQENDGESRLPPFIFPPGLIPGFLPPLIPSPVSKPHGMQPSSNKPPSPIRASEAVDSVSDSNSANSKRARTRISEEQLRILRANFNLNNSPSDECISRMSVDTGLAVKVIKHWFRNTLFKERQRSKDSPYNFNIPPATQLNLEEYERSGKVEVQPAKPEEAVQMMDAQLQAGFTKINKKRQRTSAGSNHSGDSLQGQENEQPHLKKCKTSYYSQESTIYVDDSSNQSLDLSISTEDPNNRRPRTLITAEQTEVLNYEYKSNCNPTRKQLDGISQRVGLPKRVVQVWFQNYRARERRLTAPPRLVSAPSSQNSCDVDAPLDLSHSSHESEAPSLVVQAATLPPAVKIPNSGYITPNQTYVLRAVFRDFKSPSFDELDILCQHTNLSHGMVDIWFKNNISKERRLFEESELPESVGTLQPGGPCEVCCCALPADQSIRHHIFSSIHLDNLMRKAQADKGGLPLMLPNSDKVGPFVMNGRISQVAS